MLQTLRAYGAQRLTEAGEQPAAAAKLAAYALKLADQAARGLQTSPGERAAAIWLDAEDATVHQALAWALEHDLDTALSLTVALAPWWWLRSRDAAGSALLSRAAEHAQEGGKQWCEARLWLGRLTMMSGPASLSHSTAVRDALTGGPASPMLAWTLAERAGCLANLGQLPEAAAEASRALALAKEIGDSANQARTLYWLGGIAHYAGNCKEAVAWLRQAQQIDPASIPGGLVRGSLIGLATALTAAGELTEAEQNCARALTLTREADDLASHSTCLTLMADLDLLADRIPEATAHLRKAIQLVSRIGRPWLLADCLDVCGHLCARTHRWADALTAWAAASTVLQDSGMLDPPHEVRRREEPLRKAQQALGSDRARAAKKRGAAMAAGTAVEYAVLLVSKDLHEPPAATPRLPPLSARERELVTLVAQGRTNTQIAGILFISVRTVSSHLDRIRDKTGCRRRTDLTRLALQAGLV